MSRKSFRDHCKALIGKYTLILIGFFVVMLLSTFLFYKMGYNNGRAYGAMNAKQIRAIIRALPKGKGIDSSDLQMKIATNEEKIAGINKRFDDLYIFGGIILGLIGIILAGVYIKSEQEVSKHLKETFHAQKEEIEGYVGDAKVLLERMQSQSAIADAIHSNSQGSSNTSGTVGS